MQPDSHLLRHPIALKPLTLWYECSTFFVGQTLADGKSAHTTMKESMHQCPRGHYAFLLLRWGTKWYSYVICCSLFIQVALSSHRGCSFDRWRAVKALLHWVWHLLTVKVWAVFIFRLTVFFCLFFRLNAVKLHFLFWWSGWIFQYCCRRPDRDEILTSSFAQVTCWP